MKLNDLKNVLTPRFVVLYEEFQKPYIFEACGIADYRQLHEVEAEDDTMFKKYGSYEVEQIYSSYISEIGHCVCVDLKSK